MQWEIAKHGDFLQLDIMVRMASPFAQFLMQSAVEMLLQSTCGSRNTVISCSSTSW